MKSLHPKSHMSIILKNISKCNGFLLFNSLSELQTKPLLPIRHICDFSRGALNVRSTRSHPTLAPRPQICLIGGNGFCAVAGEGELNRGDIWGQKLMSSAYSKMTGNRGDDLTCNILRASRKLLPSPPNPHNHYLIQTKSSQRQPGKRSDSLYLWPRSYETVVKFRKGRH